MEKPVFQKPEEDFSIFLEWSEKEKEEMEELGERIKNRIKFITVEAAALSSMREDPKADPEKIRQQERILADVYNEMMSLQEELKKKMMKIRTLLDLHKKTTKELENFNPNIEH